MDIPRILIVEDEQRLAGLLKLQLEDAGFATDIADNGYTGKMLMEQNTYNLVLLDLNLPMLNGYELCREIRKTNTDVPIIMLTAMGTPDNKLNGFEVGADDYIVKPFDFRELLARVNVFMRRSDIRVENSRLQISDLEMDITNRSVRRAGKKIDLTAREFTLLETFIRNKDKLLTREYIIENVWGIDFDPSTNIIDVYINYLRKKIDRDFEPKLLHTKFGFGFYLSENEI